MWRQLSIANKVLIAHRAPTLYGKLYCSEYGALYGATLDIGEKTTLFDTTHTHAHISDALTHWEYYPPPSRYLQRLMQSTTKKIRHYAATQIYRNPAWFDDDEVARAEEEVLQIIRTNRLP